MPLKLTLRPARDFILLAVFITLISAGCLSPQIAQDDISITLHADGESQQINIPAGSNVEETLILAKITLAETDRVDPPTYSILSDTDEIHITRIREVFETQEEIIPFVRQIVRSESLPESQNRLIQLGENGLQEITYRTVFEDDIEISHSLVKTTILTEPVPEIMMIGVQAIFAPLPVPGVLAYLSGGNAWIMEDSTANRRPIVTTGDLDGRVFVLSPNAGWLLYTRKSEKDPSEEINTLWVVSTTGEPKEPINLKVSNVVHYAGWRPEHGTRIYYSTVEPRATAPGWQANNDLYEIIFNAHWRTTPKEIIETGYGGAYGWWGTTYAWSPNGKNLAYARPDQIGMVNIGEGETRPLQEITPLLTRSDWAWIPGFDWGADGHTLFTVTHAPPPNLVSAEESPYFDLSAISTANATNIAVAPQTGMFAYPSSSPMRPSGNERMYQMAYLQAIFPAQSESSRYRLIVMDRDGSNREEVFPSEDAQGLAPQVPAWSPEPIVGQTGDFIALVYQGNLWLVDSASKQSHQITGDGSITLIDWE